MSLVFGVLVVFVGFCRVWVGVFFVFGWFGGMVFVGWVGRLVWVLRDWWSWGFGRFAVFVLGNADSRVIWWVLGYDCIW